VTDYSTAADLQTALAVEALDRNLFRGMNIVGSNDRPALFGGQVAAQALRAAGLTVDPDRRPHSLHGYFLRPGRADSPVILEVDRDRDGGSFSARHVAAIQDGEVIFSMLASFQLMRGDATARLDRSEQRPRDISFDEAPEREGLLLEMRELVPTTTVGTRIQYSDHLAVRSATPLDDDPLTHACALLYISDLSSGFGQVSVPGLGTGGPSLDHALWFQEPVRADDWVTLELSPTKAADRRGLYSGAIRSLDGNLAAVLAQEILLRGPGPDPEQVEKAEQ